MKTKIKYALIFVMLCVAQMASAQGRRISGNVFNKIDGPVMMANVVEKDVNNRIVEAAVTDFNGNFSMTIKNPKDRLEVSYVGYATAKVPIGNQSHFKIEMKEANVMKNVVITTKKKITTNGLAIPEREISVAQQSLNMDDLAGLSFTSADEALQGKIAGLDITMNSGNVGSGTTMRLRGVTSMNNSEPLIVVDGYALPKTQDQENLNFDTSEEDLQNQFSNLLSVNPEDILKIDVLKDGAACAIWGAEGANGVIQITTRKGRRGKTRVGFNYTFNGSWQPTGYNLLNGDEYTMMLKEAFYNPYQNNDDSDIWEISYKDPSVRPLANNYNKNEDWIGAVTKFGQKHKYSVTLSGGGESATFRVSASYNNVTGYIIKQKMNQFTTRMSLDYKVSDRIRFSSNFSLSYTNNDQNYSSIYGGAQRAMPNMSIYEYDMYGNNTGNYYYMPTAASTKGGDNTGLYETSYQLSSLVSDCNPLAIAEKAWRKKKDYNINPQFQIEYDLLGKQNEEGKHRLTYKGEVWMYMSTYTEDSYKPAELDRVKWTSAASLNPVTNSESKSANFRTQHTLTYTPYFNNEDHFFTGLLQVHLGTNSSQSQSLNLNNLPGSISDISAQGVMSSIGSSYSQGKSLNAVTTMHYSYKGRYVVDFSLRTDAKNAFGKGHRWGFFPGVSVRWNIIDEKFMKWSENWLSMFSVKGSWGINGNVPGQNSMYNRYRAGKTYLASMGTSFYPENLRLTEVRWEKVYKLNLGGNLGLFKDLLTFDFSYYKNVTVDNLQSVGIPTTSGFSSLESRNVGEMQNQGWELYMNTGKIAKWGKFYMTASANMSQTFNLVNEMDATVVKSWNTEQELTNYTYWKRVQVGNAWGSIFGLRYKGVYRYDYDHNGYTPESQAKYGVSPYGNGLDAYGNKINTAQAAAERGETATCPVVRDVNGNIITNSKGKPLHMCMKYGETDYYEFKGGDVIYEDINHDGQIDKLDVVYLGNSNPKFYGGFGLNFFYGPFSLRTSFAFRIGTKVINQARMYLENMSELKNQSTAVNYRWRKNGDETEIPRALAKSVYTAYNALPTDRYVEDADYTRFQYLSVAYNFDKKMLKPLGLNSASITLSTQNLFVWSTYSGIDPEHSPGGQGAAYDNQNTPPARSFTATLNVSF